MGFRSTGIRDFTTFFYIWMLELFTKGRDIIIQMKYSQTWLFLTTLFSYGWSILQPCAIFCLKDSLQNKIFPLLWSLCVINCIWIPQPLRYPQLPALALQVFLWKLIKEGTSLLLVGIDTAFHPTLTDEFSPLSCVCALDRAQLPAASPQPPSINQWGIPPPLQKINHSAFDCSLSEVPENSVPSPDKLTRGYRMVKPSALPLQ